MTFLLPDSADETTLEFRRFVTANLVKGTSVTFNHSVDTLHQYLPDSSRDAYFSDKRLIHFLGQLFPSRNGSPPSVHLDDIQGGYTGIFSILLWIGQGSKVRDFIEHPSLDDHHLPFNSKPDSFPVLPFFDNFWDDFYKWQWMFCAPKLKYFGKVKWEERRILPFTLGAELGRGASGVARRIDVHPAHDSLHSNGKESQAVGTSINGVHTHGSFDVEESSDRPPHSYVLKTFHSEHRDEKWEGEVEAFLLLRTSPRKQPGAIGFFGSFRQGSTCNIILEYADGGTLEKYFRTISPPSSSRDIHQFWKSLLRLMEFLVALQNLDFYDDSVYQGWHFDIKPSNILVCNRSSSPYECDFKLADFGSSVFRIKANSEDIQGKAGIGTRTYGAPECYRWNSSACEYFPSPKITYAVDVWSLACVLSEAATWVAFGFDGVESYRATRADQSSPGFEDPDCFHDGDDVSECVKDMHRRIRHIVDTPPKLDFTTEAVLGIVDGYMLRPRAEERREPQRLFHLTNKLMDQCADIVNCGHTDDTRRFGALQSTELEQHPPTASDHASIIQNSSSPWSASPFSYTTQDPDPFSNMSPITGIFNRDSNTTHSRPADRMAPAAQHVNRSESRSASHKTTASPNSPSAYDYNEAASRDVANSTGQVTMEGVRKPSYSHGRKSFPQVGNGERIDDTQSSRLVSRYSDTATYQAQSIYRPGHQHNIGWNANLAQLQTQATPHPSSPVADQNRLHATTTPYPASNTSQKPPRWEVDDACRWRDSSERHTLPDHQPTLELADRDFILLVDDSSTMREHWPAVVKAADLLVYILKRYGKNGIDLRFTISPKQYRAKKATPIVSIIKGHRPKLSSANRVANMEARLGDVLDAYRMKLPPRYGPASHLFSAASCKKTIVFVLTDGLWQPETKVENPIKDLVKSLREHQLPRNQFGVQFIRFGNDPSGIRMLKYLDDLPDVELDIVDTEPFRNGNVWKMLLASINQWFDNSDKDDADDTARSEFLEPASASPRSHDASPASGDVFSPSPLSPSSIHEQSQYVYTRNHENAPSSPDGAYHP